MDLSSSARGQQRRGGNGLIETAHSPHVGVKICPEPEPGDGDGDGDGGTDKRRVWGGGVESNEAPPPHDIFITYIQQQHLSLH